MLTTIQPIILNITIVKRIILNFIVTIITLRIVISTTLIIIVIRIDPILITWFLFWWVVPHEG
jgi:hypothetical protein